MTRRWLIWTGGLLLLALIALFPLRIALALSDLERMGFTARQAGGTIWYGRIGDLQLRSQPLGTFEVRLDPLPLLVGNLSMRAERMESPEGVLTGRIFAGLRRGVRDVDGRVAVGSIFAPLPVESLELSDVTLLFRGGRCVEASGSVTPLISSPLPGVGLGSGARGSLRCDGERARVVMNGSGRERLDFAISPNGSYRASLLIADAPPELGAALRLFGFRATAQGLTLSTEGQL